MTTSSFNDSSGARIERLLTTMKQCGASDLFLTVGKVPAFRLAGNITALKDEAVFSESEVKTFLGMILSSEALAQFEKSGDADAGFSLPDGQRFRFSIYRQQGHTALVGRALSSGELSLEALKLPQIISRFAGLTRGLVLITGATGSGKSTTLAALIHCINTTRNVHIVTIEDPIEFVHHDRMSRITQREVGGDTKNFNAALRHVVRQSPDVILIGEIRDSETIKIAVTASLTGHLVFATVHTEDASQTMQRILGYFPADARAQLAVDLATCLKGIVSQRLVPKKNGRSRVAAVEVLTVSPSVATLLRDLRINELQDLMRSTEDPGIITFNQSLLELYRHGSISFEVGRAYASNPDEFTLACQGMSTGTDSFRGEDSIEQETGLDMKMLLRLAQERGASDIHLTVGRRPIFRLDGALSPLEVRPLTAADMRILLSSIMTARQRSHYELERELDFSLSLDDGGRFRVNTYFQKGHMAASFRAIPTVIPNAADLNIPRVVIDLALRQQGLLLVVGPTGSGKSTTLACLVDYINHRRHCRIITVEDPIEYTHECALATVDQREVSSDTRSFDMALKYVLRQDPDVILVGEMRDLETISAAMTAAETGHLVLATLHTNDAIGAVDRIIDVFPPYQQQQIRAQLAACLLSVVSQRLIPRLDGERRIGAFEVMIANTAIRTVIRDNKMHTARSVMEIGRGEGMRTMDDSICDLFKNRQISRDSAVRYMNDPRRLGERN